MAPDAKTAMYAASEGLIPASLTRNISVREWSITMTTAAATASSTGPVPPADNDNSINVSIAIAQCAANANIVTIPSMLLDAPPSASTNTALVGAQLNHFFPQYPPLLSLQGLSTPTNSELHSVRSESSSGDTLRDQQHNQSSNCGIKIAKDEKEKAAMVERLMIVMPVGYRR